MVSDLIIGPNQDPTGYFSSSYVEARSRFRSNAQAIDASMDMFTLPSLKGIEGEDLVVDIATIGNPQASRALVLVSGTHGIEGYCGSAIQSGLMRCGAVSGPEGFKIVLVHGLNPFGFSHGRRADQGNVDLNRNFVDFGNRPVNASYGKIWHLLEKQPTFLARVHLRWLVLRHGLRTIQEAVTKGQYGYPHGLFYGGLGKTWSREIWSTILYKHLGGVDRAFFIDYHTGLGKRGTSQILSSIDPTRPAGQIARRMLSGIYGNAARFMAEDEKTVAVLPTGDLLNFTIESRPDGSYSGMFLEFGTEGPFSVLEALMAENVSIRTGTDPGAIDAAKQNLRRVFCPDDRTWQREVWRQAYGTTIRAVAAMKSA